MVNVNFVSMANANLRGENMEKEEKSTFEKMAEDIRKIRTSLESLEKSGINTEIMVLYIQNDTKLGVTKIREVLKSQKKFFNEAVKD
jgi:DNA-binding protein H-NS